MMELAVAYGLCFGSIVMAATAVYRPLTDRFNTYVDRRATLVNEELSDIFIEVEARKVWMMYAFAPLLLGMAFWYMTGGLLIAGLLGAVFGLVAPRVIVKQMRKLRHKRYHVQLIDALQLMGSSLKAGLSMIQSFGVVTEEMPPPISQEFGLLLKETRMGVSMEDAITHLRSRMPSDDMHLFATAVLVARESGGDITHIFGRLVETMRERKKLKEKITTLTFMARMQGIIMGMLPFAFGFMVYNMNNQYFDFFLYEEVGRLMLVGIVGLQIVGATLFMRFSRSPM